jgi:hypothetical protein
MGVVVFAMAGVAGAEAGGDQILDWLADELGLGVTKQLCRTRVCATDYAFGIRDKDRVWRDLEQVLQRGLSKLSLMVRRRCRCGLLRGIRRAHEWLQPELDSNWFGPGMQPENHAVGLSRGGAVAMMEPGGHFGKRIWIWIIDQQQL